MSGQPLVVVGIGHDGPAGLSTEARAHLETARLMAGGRRQLAFFPHWRGAKLLLDGDVPAFVAALGKRYREEKTVVLASGDPLFYGIGRALLDAMPRDDLLFLPHVSSVQLAFARVKETWHDAHIVSVHGRPIDALTAAIATRERKIAVLTDATNNPAAIADLVQRVGAADDYAIWVCENLGGADERVARYAPCELRSETFSPLNVVLLLHTGDRGHGAGVCALDLPVLGIPEDALLHRDGMITRREVRLLAVCYLELRPGDVLWDVGAGSGSVAIEAARLCPSPPTPLPGGARGEMRPSPPTPLPSGARGGYLPPSPRRGEGLGVRGTDIIAIERDPTSFAQLRGNVDQLGVPVRAVCAEAPDAFAGLPDPDAVFVGGSGGKLVEILHAAAARLRPGGRLVVNCITIENFSRAWDTLRALGLQPEATSVQLAHSRPLGHLHCMEPDNPIFIVRARKP